jgi:hypothetical protein
MTKEQHPITPPPELVQQWFDEAYKDVPNWSCRAATAAAQWGADQELEACCEWFKKNALKSIFPEDDLRAARRPKPQSLKQQAQAALLRLANESNDLASEDADDMETIRRALEALPND